MDLFKLQTEVSVKIDKAIDNLNEIANKVDKAADNMGKDLKDVKDNTDKASDGFTTFKGVISNLVATGISKLVSGLQNAASAVLGLSEATQEYREDMGKLETAWESAGKSTELATETYKNFYSVLGEEDRSVEAVNHLAKFVETEEDMVKWTDIATGVWGTFGDSLPIEGLTEASNETAKVGKLTGVLADALNWAGVEDFQASLDKCNSEQERNALITNTLNGLYSTAATNYKENNASIIEARKATSNFTDAQAALGERIEPITTRIREGWTRVLEKILEITEGIDFNALGEKITVAFDKLINEIIPKIIDCFTWIKDNFDLIATLIIAAGTAFATFKIVTTITQIINGFKVAMAALNAVMMANPIGLIIAAIAALVAAFVYLWHNVDGFKQFWIDAWDGILNFFKNVGEKIKQAFTGVVNFFKNSIDKIKKMFDIVLSFKGFKTPKISIEWSQKPKWMAEAAEFLGMKGVPKFSVKWNAEGAIFKEPTIFNTPNGLQGVGEAGAEAVAPIDKLQGYVSASVKQEVSGMEHNISRIYEIMANFFPQFVQGMDRQVILDTGVLVGEIAPAMDVSLGNIYDRKERSK